jgi:hypothetical protein
VGWAPETVTPGTAPDPDTEDGAEGARSDPSSSSSSSSSFSSSSSSTTSSSATSSSVVSLSSAVSASPSSVTPLSTKRIELHASRRRQLTTSTAAITGITAIRCMPRRALCVTVCTLTNFLAESDRQVSSLVVTSGLKLSSALSLSLSISHSLAPTPLPLSVCGS